MSVVATFTVPAAQFPLTRVLDVAPSVRVEVDRVLTADGAAVPVFWLFGDDDGFDSVERALARLDRVTDVVELASLDGQRLYRATWRGGDEGDVLDRLARGPETVLEAHGTVDAAEIAVRFPDEEAYAAFSAWMADANVPVSEVNEYRPDADRETDAGDVEFLLAAADGVVTRLRTARSRLRNAF